VGFSALARSPKDQSAILAVSLRTFIKQQEKCMRFVGKLGHPLWFFTTLVLGTAIGWRVHVWYSLNGQAETVPLQNYEGPVFLIIAVLMLFVAILNDRLFDTKALRTLEDIKNTSEKKVEQIQQVIADQLTPSLLELSEPDQVLHYAADLINVARKEVTPTEKFLLYIGSGDLLKEPPEIHDLDRNSPAMEYQSAVSAARNDHMQVDRYICLIEPWDFQRRQQPTREGYRAWVLKQIENLERNPNYTFWHTMRAPQWGSSRSSIFTSRAMLDVVGNGNSGVLVRGEKISGAIKKGSKALFENTFVPPVQYTSTQLRGYLESLMLVANQDDTPPAENNE
jgi:hypothetical protein